MEVSKQQTANHDLFIESGYTTSFTNIEECQGRQLIRLPEFQQVSEFILQSAHNYFNFNGIPQENVRIIMSWGNVYPKGSYIKHHSHSTFDSLTSGVLCLEAGDSLLHVKGRDPYRLDKGDLIIFPSHLDHWTSPNLSDNDRVILGFDIYFGKRSDDDIQRKLSKFGG